MRFYLSEEEKLVQLCLSNGLYLLLLFAFSGCIKPPLMTASEVVGSAGLNNRHNLLANSAFEDGSSLPWAPSFTAPGSGSAGVKDGWYCLEVTNKGVNNWDAQVRHREMVIQRGHVYTVRFTAKASQPTYVRPKVGMAGPPYAEYWTDTIKLTEKPQVFSATFLPKHKDDPTAELAFHVGGKLALPKPPFQVCIDNVVLSDPDFIQPVTAKTNPTLSDIVINQLGYLPKLAKIAVVKNQTKSSLGWQLVSSYNEVVLSGQTTVYGQDRASGDHVHIVDFSSYSSPGTGFRLKVGSSSSRPFRIDSALYNKLKYDALAYFYHARSGVPIEMPFAGEAKWVRPAGHLSDKSVACAPNSDCNYSLDVSGGWYDAGDHGKYVVNGGIALWTLFNMYERNQQLSGSNQTLMDGKMNIPESNNGVPDILDEARFEMEFLLKMQVPQGQPLQGMVHHKIHNKAWTELGTPPHKDKIPRYLQPPSTAATLNLAATAAQSGRVFRQIDPAFSSRCIQAAERAWNAAQKSPSMYASINNNQGGGAYEDNYVTDEFFWAAAELFITTNKSTYREYLNNHTSFMYSIPKVLGGEAADHGHSTSMTWQNTQTLGNISLAVVPNQLAPEELQKIRSALVETADYFVDLISVQGYRIPFVPGPDQSYPWGSNSFILNNLLIIALAYDFTTQPRYLNAVAIGMDYILGRNPLDQSYVTGYGYRPLRNPHHRFWANQIKKSLPSPPPGAVSGGPNSGLQDPYIKAAGIQGKPPAKCFIDHIESWSSNEITINWNAPFAWLCVFLDEKARM